MNNGKKENLTPQMKLFFEGFEERFNNPDKRTCCDWNGCNQRLLAKEIQVFAFPNSSIKIFCSEHLMATTFKHDKVAFEKVVNEQYLPKDQDRIRRYFKEEYGSN